MTPRRAGLRILLAAMIVAISTIALAATGSAQAASIAHRPTTVRQSHGVPRWPAPRQILVLRHLRANKRYTIHVSVSSMGARPSQIRIAIGRRILHAVTTRRHRTAIVTTRLRPTRPFIVIIVAYPAHGRMRVHVRIGSVRLPLRKIVLHEHVAAPGLYAVSIVVASRSRTRNRIHLTIGGLSRYAVTTHRRRHIIVRARVSVAGAMLTVRARGRFRARLSVALHAILAVRRISGGSGSSGVSNVAPVVPAASQAIAVPAAAPAPPPAPVGLPGSWHLVFDDEFNGTSLDTSKWSNLWFGHTSGPNGEAISASNVTEGNGVLSLEMTAGNIGALISSDPSGGGGAGTGFQFTYGFAEARIWFPGSGTAIYNWPAWWTDGQNWPADSESDIFEGLGSATSNYHSSGGDSNSNTIPGVWANGWHTYGLDREPGIDTIYWDGNVVRSYATQDGGAPQYLILTTGCCQGPTVTGPASTVMVDYVRVWSH